MSGSDFSKFPHLSWLSHRRSLLPPRAFGLCAFRGVAHRLVFREEGSAEVEWKTLGKTSRYQFVPGDLGFFPADGRMHAFAMTPLAPCRASEILLPPSHLQGVLEEGTARRMQLSPIPVFQDAHLKAFLQRLMCDNSDGSIAQDSGVEIAARQILLRLAHLTGAASPDWTNRGTVFSASAMQYIVERVDASLAQRLSLGDLCSEFCLSESHFARKFKNSSGMSFSRFVIRRRIQHSFGLLRSSFLPIARLSLDLGFCSQSHFTRQFSQATGYTPHQFRRFHTRA
jgi:AraC-like DNA-binding protein